MTGNRSWAATWQRQTNTAKKTGSEFAFRLILNVSAFGILALVLGMFVTLVLNSLPSLRAVGLHMLVGKIWDPVSGEFGQLPFLTGTILSAFLALLISLPFSLAIAITLGEYLREGIGSTTLSTITELLAGIPSVIYGFWGLALIVPIIRAVEVKFNVAPYGVGILAASLILAIMIIPFSASMAREVIRLVPRDIKEAAYSLGATRSEVVWKVSVPYARAGIAAGLLLSLGRALGETMAVTMMIGNSNFIPKSIFGPASTMASIIANEFTEATDSIHLSALIELGLLLFIVTAFINLIGNSVIKKMRIRVV